MRVIHLDNALLNQYLVACTRRAPEFFQLADEAIELRSSGTAVEIGMGPSPILLDRLSSRFEGCLVGTDIDPRSISLSLRRVQAGNRIGLIVCAAESLPFKDGGIDLILSINSLHHWTSPTQVLVEIRRVLRRNGRALIADLRRDLSQNELRSLERQYDGIVLKYRFRKSVSESYLPDEILAIASQAGFDDCRIRMQATGMLIKLHKRRQASRRGPVRRD